jgi:hypothetical protein
MRIITLYLSLCRPPQDRVAAARCGVYTEHVTLYRSRNKKRFRGRRVTMHESDVEVEAGKSCGGTPLSDSVA